jgi:tRNA (guanine-N7-)-methyltransferase
MAAAQSPIRSFGRTRSRAIKPRQAALFDSLLPEIALDPSAGSVEPRALAPEASAVWLEIGFGGGEHMVAQAAGRPDVLVIGAEPFQNGAASALRHIEALRLSNVRLHVGDARALLDALPDGVLDRVFILFPDPWPKARHHKRRLIQADVISSLSRTMKPGALLRFASDWVDYVDWTLERLLAAPAFHWTAERADDWRTPPADHVTTRYEAKRLGDTAPVWLEFERVQAGQRADRNAA